MTSLSCHQSCVWVDYVGDNIHAADIVLPSIVLAYCTTMSQKCKSASPRAIQVKNSRKIVGTDKKLDIINRLENVNVLLTYAVMLDSLMVAYVQLVIMLLELQKVLSQELKCFLCSKTTTVML